MMNKEQFTKITFNHQLWLSKRRSGKKANFSQINLKNTKIVGINLAHSIFDKTNLYKSEFIGVNLNYTSFYSANLEDTQFFNCWLFETDFRKANLKNTKFIDCYFISTVVFHNLDMIIKWQPKKK